jgi:hypothetical protein
MDENRITIEPGKRSGQPCIRGLRITVWEFSTGLRGDERKPDSQPTIRSWSPPIFPQSLTMRLASGVAWPCERSPVAIG